MWLVKDSGPVGFLVIPGYGPAWGDTGMTEYTVDPATWDPIELFKTSAHNFYFEEEDLLAVCSYLGGE